MLVTFPSGLQRLSSSASGLHNIRPAFLASRESFLYCRKCCKSL